MFSRYGVLTTDWFSLSSAGSNQMNLGGGAMGVATSDPTNLHSDSSLPSTLNK